MKIDDLTKMAVNHTLHCLLGCSIGEILGMVIVAALGWSNPVQTALSVVLAFFFGYLLTYRSFVKSGTTGKAAVKGTLATDTLSITSMEIIDNVFIWLVPGAIYATLVTGLFWWSLAVSLAIAFIVTVPVNRFLMQHGIGHACN
jgi:putative flippase GtrA